MLKIKPKTLFVSTGLFLAVLFFIFTFLVRADLLHQFDFDTTVRLQDNLSSHLRLSDFFCFLSNVGNFEILTGVLIILLILKRKIIGAVVTIGFFGLAHVIEIIGKTFLDHSNPPQFFIKCYNFFPSTYIQPGYSYPSGHSLRTVFIATLLLVFIIINKRINWVIKSILSIPIIGLTIIMLISRVSLGEHWPTDVIGGTFLGAAFAFLSLLFL